MLQRLRAPPRDPGAGHGRDQLCGAGQSSSGHEHLQKGEADCAGVDVCENEVNKGEDVRRPVVGDALLSVMVSDTIIPGRRINSHDRKYSTQNAKSIQKDRVAKRTRRHQHEREGHKEEHGAGYRQVPNALNDSPRPSSRPFGPPAA